MPLFYFPVFRTELQKMEWSLQKSILVALKKNRIQTLKKNPKMRAVNVRFEFCMVYPCKMWRWTNFSRIFSNFSQFKNRVGWANKWKVRFISQLSCWGLMPRTYATRCILRRGLLSLHTIDLNHVWRRKPLLVMCSKIERVASPGSKRTWKVLLEPLLVPL